MPSKIHWMQNSSDLRSRASFRWWYIASELAPTVVVPMGDGNLRVCGDYQVSLNASLDIDQYPLARTRGPCLTSWCQCLSKTDLSQAYQQMALEQSSKNLVIINTSSSTSTVSAYDGHHPSGHSKCHLPHRWHFGDWEDPQRAHEESKSCAEVSVRWWYDC